MDDDEPIAHSYYFDLWDGGRHHPYENFKQVEDGLIKEAIERTEASGRARAIITEV